MTQPPGIPPRFLRVEVPASTLQSLAERLAPVMHQFVDELGIDHRTAAHALQAYAGAMTALANLRIDGDRPIEQQIPAFTVGWNWGKGLLDKQMRGEPAAASQIIVPGAAQ